MKNIFKRMKKWRNVFDKIAELDKNYEKKK